VVKGAGSVIRRLLYLEVVQKLLQVVVVKRNCVLHVREIFFRGAKVISFARSAV
jgi:hypothetical protein